MTSAKNKTELLKDIKSAIISEMISHDFYSKSATSVKIISGMHAFQDMMWDEEMHVKKLKEEYKKLGGSESIKYDPREYGGLALPKLEVDAVIALDVAMKEEKSSIKMYKELLKKHKAAEPQPNGATAPVSKQKILPKKRSFDGAIVKETSSVKLFEQLLSDEKKHLDQWNSISKNIIGSNSTDREEKDEVYRFSKEDLEIIKMTLKAERAAYDFYKNASGKIDTIDGSHAFQHMAWEEKIHVKMLEDEYFRLTNQKPKMEKPEKKHPLKIKKNLEAVDALDLSIKEEKASLKRYLELEEKCTNTRLKEVIWELIESEWNHISQWRSTQKSIKEKNFPLF